MEALRNLLPNTERSFEPPDRKLMAQLRVDGFNATEGNLDQLDGYACDLCWNKGQIMYLTVENGVPQEWAKPCKCMTARAAIRRMKRSGLGNVIKEKTFERYNATEPWQQALKDAAMAYAKEPAGWFFMGGQSGCGKSHLGAAICRHFLLAGKSVVYMSWLDDVDELKTRKAEREGGEVYRDMKRRYKETQVLYIDDLFKNAEKDDAQSPPTDADIKLAFEILNHRSMNPDLLTIVSSEYYVGQLVDLNEALGSRIVEMAGGNSFNIAKERSRNYRLKGVTVL